MLHKRSADLGSYGPDSSGAPHYEAGNPYGICDRCAGKYRRHGPNSLRLEWTSLWVCQTCWDPRPPEMTTPNVWPEGVAIPYPKPEPPNIFVQVDIPPDYPESA